MTAARPMNSLMKHLRGSAPLDPARDWLLVLTVAALAFTALVVWNVWMFDTVARGGSLGGAPSDTPAAFDRASLDTIHAIFDSRAAEEAKYVTGAYRYADPSQ